MCKMDVHIVKIVILPMLIFMFDFYLYVTKWNKTKVAFAHTQKNKLTNCYIVRIFSQFTSLH